MSNSNIELLKEVSQDVTPIYMGDVVIMDDLKSTLDSNIKRVNKNTNEYMTPTHIIFNYVRWINATQLRGVVDKKEYLRVAKNLIKELKSVGFVVGDDWRDNNKLPYSKGNSKLPSNIVIFNLAPAALCISHNMGLCDLCRVCYALSSESRYINTLIYRLTQLIRFEELSVEDIVTQFKRLRVFDTLRINESGDIYEMNDFLKLKEIAKRLYDLKGVNTYLYTHRSDLFDDLKREQTDYIKVNRSQIDYNSLPSIHSNHSHLYCDGDCDGCIFCKVELLIPVDGLLHGDEVGVDLRDDDTIKRDLRIKQTTQKMFDDGCSIESIRDYVKKELKYE